MFRLTICITLFFIISSLLILGCQDHRTVINSMSAPPKIETSKLNINNVLATYHPDSDSFDVSIDSSFINGKKYEIYVGAGNSIIQNGENPNNVWASDVNGWSCVCSECSDNMSFGGLGDGGSGGGGGGGGGGGSGDNKCGEDSLLGALYGGMLGVHLLIDTDNDGTLDSDVIIKMDMEAPKNVLASKGTYNDKIHISWGKTSDASSYMVFRYPEGGNINSSTFLNETSSDNFDDFAPIGGDPDSANKKYYYAVKSKVNCGGISSYSSVDLGWLGTNSGTSILASDGVYEEKIAVTWSAINGAVSYELFKDGVYISNPSSNSFDDISNLEVGKTYNYKVRGVVGGVYTAFSSEDPGSVKDFGTVVVTAVTQTGNNTVLVSWTPDLGSTTAYEIYRERDSKENLFPNYGHGSVTDLLSKVDFDNLSDRIQPEKTYYYQIRPIKNGVKGRVSNIASVILPLEDYVPVITTVNSTGRLDISWGAVEVATGYSLTISSNSDYSGAMVREFDALTLSCYDEFTGATHYYKFVVKFGSRISKEKPWSVNM